MPRHPQKASGVPHRMRLNPADICVSAPPRGRLCDDSPKAALKNSPQPQRRPPGGLVFNQLGSNMARLTPVTSIDQGGGGPQTFFRPDGSQTSW